MSTQTYTQPTVGPTASNVPPILYSNAKKTVKVPKFKLTKLKWGKKPKPFAPASGQDTSLLGLHGKQGGHAGRGK